MSVENTTKNMPEARQKQSPQPTEGGTHSYLSTLYQICQEENIKMQLLSLNWVKRLEKDGKVRFIAGSKFDLNRQALGQVLDDKYALYSVLEYAGIPIIKHEIIYEPDNESDFAQGRNSLAYAKRFWEAHDRDIVIKANCNVGGGWQVLRVRDEAELAPTLAELFQKKYSLSLCPFYHIAHEYRLIMLDGEARLKYMKTLPKEEGAWKFNLHQGSTAEEIPAEKLPAILDLAQRTCAATGLRFGSVDIVELESGELMIMEINSSIGTSRFVEQYPERYPEVKEMFRDAIRKMFED